MRSDGRLDPSIVDAALATLLDRHPDAVTAAFGPDGLMVEMPGSVPLAGHRVVRARSALNLVVAGDRAAVIAAWERARALGASRVPVRFASDPLRPVVVHFLDARRSFGVYLGVVAAADGDDTTVFDPATPTAAPRFARRGDNVLEAAVEILRAREHALARMAEACPTGVLQVDALGRVVLSNDLLHDVLGCPRAATLDELLETVAEVDRPLVRAACDRMLADGDDDDLDITVSAPPPPAAGGPDPGVERVHVRPCTVALRALTNGDGEVTGGLLFVTDMSSEVSDTNAGHERHERSSVDALTRCHDRAWTVTALETMLAGAGDGSSPAAICVHLDRLDELNDTYGRDTADEFLGVVARRLLGAVREDDIVGRVGDDEFLVVCPGVATAAEAVRTAGRVADTLAHRVQLKELRTGSGATVGVAWSSGSGGSSGSGIDAETLMARAGTARVESKRRGTGRPVLYSPAMVETPEPSG